MRATPPPWATELRLAWSVGLVGGCLLGAREALLTLEANAFAQPGQYFFLYLALPVLTCIALGSALMLPVGVAGYLLRRNGFSCGGHFAGYIGTFAFAGGLSINVAWLGAIVDRLGEVGLEPGGIRLAVPGLLAMGLAAALAAAAGAVAISHEPLLRRVLGYGTAVALLIALLAVWPVATFVAGDWRWEAGATPVAGPNDRPNVLLISIDTLRADALGSYGGAEARTPSLDTLAAEGVRFENAITSAPWTLPAIASLLTGLEARQHGAGAIGNGHDPLGRSALPAGVWTVTRELRQRGYRTKAIVTNPYLTLRYGIGDGFDGYENVTIESEAFLALQQTTLVRLLNWLWPDLAIGDRGETVSARAVRWLERAGAGSPFLLWLHYVDPHPPYSAPGVTRNKTFRGDALFGTRPVDLRDLPRRSPDPARLRSGEIRLDPGQKEVVRALYRAEVTRVDAAVGLVLEALDRLGLRDQTLVVCVADHGEEFWEHGGVEHGHTVYDELVRVPLLLRWPSGLPRGTVVDELVRIIDVAPTILDLLGMAPSRAADGTTLLPLLRGDPGTPRVARVENMLFAEERIGLRTADRKYIRWDTGREEVYDLISDRREQRDLVGIDAHLRPLRGAYARSNASGRTAGLTSFHDGPRAPIPTAALRALGYVH